MHLIDHPQGDLIVVKIDELFDDHCDVAGIVHPDGRCQLLKGAHAGQVRRRSGWTEGTSAST